ncbi:MAG TPA: PTS sugar transporter subunit IIA [Candidatus Sulfomarinibacteraceae bacterium]|nr:PTS sugar transporter subunit IIA [Candidatus Sulfomarinibacteraceae bacterium]
MIPVLVLTHGELANALLESARKIDPHLDDETDAITLPWDVDTDTATAELRERLKAMDNGSGVLVLTDMFGGTATNLALPFLVPDRIEIVTGANLPMLVKLGSLRGRDIPLGDLAARLAESGQKSIRLASEFLRNRSAG